MLTVLLIAYALVVTVLFVLACGGNADLAEENRRLRRDHLRIVHPSTRRNAR